MVNTLAGGSGECEWPVSQISLKMSSLIPAKQVERIAVTVAVVIPITFLFSWHRGILCLVLMNSTTSSLSYDTFQRVSAH